MSAANKPAVPIVEIGDFLSSKVGQFSDLTQLTEGLDSQAFGFSSKGESFGLRINRRIEGFQKDAFVAQYYSSSALSIPEVLDVGLMDRDHAYCISRRVAGVRLFDLEPAALHGMLEPILDLFKALQAVDISDTPGFGHFDSRGIAPHQSWRDHLLEITEPASLDWTKDLPNPAAQVVNEACRLVKKLAPSWPEERKLTHGDFGSYNVLSDGKKITAVIDWDLAVFGDPLYDIANLFFWQEQKLLFLIRHLESAYADLPNFRERMLSYQLRIGTREISMAASGLGLGDCAWLVERCAQILANA